ncbi:ankyrin repeat protein [Apiospora sp. TS-2023a]
MRLSNPGTYLGGRRFGRRAEPPTVTRSFNYSFCMELISSLETTYYIYERTRLHLASYRGQSANVLSFLQFGAGIESRMSTGRTPLLNSIAYNQFPTVEMLVKQGAQANVFDSDGRGILHLAALFGFPKVMQALQQVDLTWVAVDRRDNEGRTAEECFLQCRANFYTGKAKEDESDEDAFQELLRGTGKAQTKIHF